MLQQLQPIPIFFLPLTNTEVIGGRSARILPVGVRIGIQECQSL